MGVSIDARGKGGGGLGLRLSHQVLYDIVEFYALFYIPEMFHMHLRGLHNWMLAGGSRERIRLPVSPVGGGVCRPARPRRQVILSNTDTK